MSFEEDLMYDAWGVRHAAVKVVVTYSEEHPEYGRDGIEGYFDQVPDMFKPFSKMPDPAGYQPMIDAMRKVLEELSSGQHSQDPINTKDTYYANETLTKLSGMESYIEDWTGKAADAFKREFIDPFPALARNQFIVAAVLKGALEAHQEMWEKARRDIREIATNTIKALEESHDCGKNEWTVTFTVIASVAVVAGAALLAPPIGATAAGLAVTGVAAGSTVASVVPPDEQTVPYSGESAFVVITQMTEAITKLYEEIAAQEKKIYQALSSTHDVVHGNMHMFVSKRPALADANAGNVTSPEYLGYTN